MAYEGGGLVSLWKPDLSTREGARSAIASAKFGFLIVGGFRAAAFLIGTGFATAFGNIDLGSTAAMLLIGGLLIEIGLPLLAAARLHVYQGAFVAPVATALYVLGILASFNIASLVIGAIFTGVFISGCRGAWSLRRNARFDDDVIDTFS
jgi:hypothetical protein